MCTIRMTAKLHQIIRLQLQRLLELLPNLDQSLFAGTIATFAFAHRPRPQPDPKEGLSDIDDHAHNFVVVVFLEGLSDGGQLRVQPQFVDVDAFLVLELV
jgi:hypothetical protein